jgi:hypothetical protein
MESVSIPEDRPVKLIPLLEVPVPNVIDIVYAFLSRCNPASDMHYRAGWRKLKLRM